MDLFDPGNIHEELKKELSNELRINKDDFIISYLGSTGGWYLTSETLQFCKKVIDIIPHTKILFISPQNHSEIKSAAGKFDIPDEKIIVRYGRRHEVPALLSFSKFSVFFIKPCYSKMSSSPTKHGEIMAMGIPVISNAGVGDVKEVIEKYNAGFVLNELNENEYEKCIRLIAMGKLDPSKIRLGAEDYYSLDKAVQQYLLVYKKILG